jgi:hypothetical protein
MKIRNGFVSNSSSSSFVVAFPKKPDNAEEVQYILRLGEHVVAYGEVMHGYDAALRVYQDILLQKANNKEEITESMEEFYETEIEARRQLGLDEDCFSPISTKDLNRANKLVKKINKDKVDKFLKENEGSEIYCFHYSDNDGESVLEHGDIFNSVPNNVRSNH